jgi:hypothetical protein
VNASYLLNQQFAAALGLPKGTRRATLHLEVDKPPRLEVECFQVPMRVLEDPETGVQRLATIHFMLRLEPFSQPTTEKDPP